MVRRAGLQPARRIPDEYQVNDGLSQAPPPLEAALRTLLEQHPTALVSGIDDRGIFTGIADEIAGVHERLRGKSALDLVVPGDRVVVIRAWERARDTGASRAAVHLAGDSEHEAMLHFFDVRAEYGVYAAVVIADGAVNAIAGTSAGPALPARLAVQRKNEVAVFTEVDEATTEMLGWQPDEIVGRASLDFVHPDDHDRAIETWMEMLVSPGHQRRTRVRYRHSDGRWIWLELTNHNLLDDPDYECVLTECLDVTDEMAVHESLRAREQLLDRIAQTIPLGLLQLDVAGQVVYSNARLAEILGLGKVDVDVPFRNVVDEDRAHIERAREGLARDGLDCDLEVRVQLRRKHDDRLCRLSMRALTDQSGAVTGALVCVEDVTESARLRAELEERATFDALTGCLNRASVMARLDDLLHAGVHVGVIFVDLDDFKAINDRFGHAAGDDVLTAVGARLRDAVRVDDHVGRLGGDEFLVLCPAVDDALEAEAIAARVASALSVPVVLGDESISPRGSIGVATSADCGTRVDCLVARADEAMYESKREGLGRPVVSMA